MLLAAMEPLRQLIPEIGMLQLAGRLQIGTAKGAKSLLYRLARGQHQHKPARVDEPCAQLDFQSTVCPFIPIKVPTSVRNFRVDPARLVGRVIGMIPRFEGGMRWCARV